MLTSMEEDTAVIALMTPLPLLIKDTLGVIFSHLPLQALVQCAYVSKKWRDMVSIWSTTMSISYFN